jgi:hypothetical protein
MFSRLLAPIVSMPQRCGVERGSATPMRFSATIILSFIMPMTKI